jgi:hypothetical protein
MYFCVFFVPGSLDSKIIVWYTKDWNHMNIIDVDILSPILCIDVSIDGTFLVAGTCVDKLLHNFGINIHAQVVSA